MQLVIDTAQTKITVKDQCFYIQNKTVKRQISPKRVTSIAITSNALVSAKAMMLATENKVPIYYYDRVGDIKAKVWSPYFTNLSSIRKKQILLTESVFALQFSLDNLLLKLNSQEELVTKQARLFGGNKSKVEQFQKSLEEVRSSLRSYYGSHQTITILRSTVMGLEGGFAQVYWKTLNAFIQEEYRFTTRSRRPAKDMFNATLNYLYGMTYGVVEQGVFASGLDPNAGFLHAENYKKTSLVFDLIEPFRSFVDEQALIFFQNEELQTSHFRKDQKGYFLAKEGKKIVIPKYNDLLESRLIFDGKSGKLKDHIFRYCSALVKRIKETSL